MELWSGHLYVRRRQDMWLDAVKPADVHGRSAVQRLLPGNPTDALAQARQIQHPWYRCQALTSVAEVVQPRSEVLKVLAEAFAAAFEQEEPNRVVSVACWPLKHLVKLDPNRATSELARLLSVAATEPHGLRRLDALNGVLGAVAQEATLRTLALEPYLATAAVCVGWRTERTFAFMAQHIANFDMPLAKRMLATRVPNRFANKAAESLRVHESRNDA